MRLRIKAVKGNLPRSLRLLPSNIQFGQVFCDLDHVQDISDFSDHNRLRWMHSFQHQGIVFNLIELNNCCIVQAYSLKFSDRYFWDWFIFPVWKNRCFFCKMEWKQHKFVIPNWIWDGGGKVLHKTWGRVQKNKMEI